MIGKLGMFFVAFGIAKLCVALVTGARQGWK